MAASIQDYLIDQKGIDWSAALSGWSWMLPPEFTLWLVNRFADMFLVLTDGTVHMLDVGAGTFTKIADDRRDFSKKIDQGDNASDWLMIPLVDQLVAAGVLLKPGQCYGFKIPPIMGGAYSVENCGPLSIQDYLGAYASLHEQLRDVPDGTEVVLKVVKPPGKRQPQPQRLRGAHEPDSKSTPDKGERGRRNSDSRTRSGRTRRRRPRD